MIDHQAVAGREALAPPDVDTARQYLTRAEAIVEQRERVVDRRAAAWLTIGTAVFVAAYLLLAVHGFRQEVPSVEIQSLLVPLLVLSQISTGIAQRGDRGPRRSASRRLLTVGGVVIAGGVLIVFFLILVNPSISTSWILLPILAVLLGDGGRGVVRLIRASRGPRPLPAVRTPLTDGARWGTIAVGVLLGAVCAVSAVPDAALASFLLFVSLLALLAWISMSSTGIGLPLLGASWRWPHILALAVSAVVFLALRLPAIDGVAVAPATFLVVGLGIVLMFVVVSMIPGRDLDA